MPKDGGHFVIHGTERDKILKSYPELKSFIRLYIGSEQMIQGKSRWCIWIEESQKTFAEDHPYLSKIISKVKEFRLESKANPLEILLRNPIVLFKLLELPKAIL